MMITITVYDPERPLPSGVVERDGFDVFERMIDDKWAPMNPGDAVVEWQGERGLLKAKHLDVMMGRMVK